MKSKRIISFVLCAFMTLVLMPTVAITAYAADTSVNTGTALQDALADASDGDVITLTDNINATSNVSFDTTGKTITIDGNGFTLTGPDTTTDYLSYGLRLNGSGTVILKDIELQGGNITDGTSNGLHISDDASLNVLSRGTVNATGGTAGESNGVYNGGGSTINITSATGGASTDNSIGVYNKSSGIVNVVTATGGTAANAGESAGIFNVYGGTVNVITAIAVNGYYSCGVDNNSGMVNVTTAISGTANISAATNNISGTVNAKTCSGGSIGTVNTDVNTLTLHKRFGAECVLDSITVAANADTTVGMLPGVFYDDTYYSRWYTDPALTSELTGTVVTAGTTDLYSAANIFTISGKVTDSSGSGLAVALQLKNSTGAAVGSAVTAASDGTYTISGVTEGTGYTISVTMSGYDTGTITAFDVTDSDVTGKNLALTAMSSGDSGGSSGGGSSSTSYVIKATAGPGGTITPRGSTAVTSGKSKTFAIAAGDGYEIDEVLVDGSSVGAVAAYTFKNVTKTHTIVASFKETVPKAANPFTDVTAGDWFYESVMSLYQKGVMTGSGSNTFRPDGTMTRGMIAAVLLRLDGDSGSYVNPFADVASGSYYENAAAWAAAKGITSGTGDRSFAPNRSLSREQLAVMLYHYAVYKGYDVSASDRTVLDGYTDSSEIASWANEAMAWAVSSGIITGSDGKLNPKGNATRAEVAAMLQRFTENAAK